MSLQKTLKSGTQSTLQVAQGGTMTIYYHFLGGLH
jgi:hypothetical protein